MTVGDAPQDVSARSLAGRQRLQDARRRTETARLLSRARASAGARRSAYENDVVQLNMQVAQDVARRYYGRGIPPDDIDQVAFLGLLKAVRGYQPMLGQEFLSYAVPTIRGEIRKYFRDSGWTIRPPRSVQEVQSRVLAAEAELLQKLGRAPRDTEIAVHLEINLDLVVAAREAGGCFNPDSLDVSPTGGGHPRESLGQDDPAFASTEARLALAPIMESLNERDRRIVELRFFDNATQEQIGREVGISQEQVSRSIRGILERMRLSLV